jgi:pimeloyl-ACP methyl ester carboxylesterase
MLKSALASQPLLGRRYETAGRRLALHRSGQDGPTVVFLPGAGLIGLDYLNVHDAVARFATSVIYDRAGTGWSDDIALPRTAAAVADELRALLTAANIPGPYVLVGHSLGGAYARRFAQRYPADTAGLVMLDPAHEGYASMPGQSLWAQVRQAVRLAPVLLDFKGFYRGLFGPMFAAWPAGLREALVDYHLRSWGKSLAEAKTLQSEVLAEVVAGGPLPDVPLKVLVAMGIDPFMAPLMPADDLRELNVRKRAMYQAFARSAPRGEAILLDGAGHSTIHTDRPDAVVDAIREVVEATRPSPAPSARPVSVDA